MNRSVIIHGTVLGASLLAAYLVWTREPSTDKEDEVNILGFSSLDRVLFESPERKVEITRDKDDFGTYHWVRVETQRKQPRMPRRPPVTRRPPMPAGRPAPGVAPRAPGATPRAPRGAPPVRRPTPPAPRVAPPPRRPTPPAPRVAPPVRRPAPPAPSATPPAPKGPASLAQDPKADPDKAPAARKVPATARPSGKPAAPTARSAAPIGKPAAPPPRRAPAKPKTITNVKAFVGNQTAEELFESLASFPAARALGPQPEDKLKEFGLSESKSTLTIVSGSTTRKFIVGDRTYGNLDYYVQDTADKRVYVVRQNLIEQVKSAQSRLYAANLHDFTLSDVERVVASTDGKRKTLLQHDRTKARAAYWTDEGAADKKQGKDAYRNWIGKVDALRVNKYTTRDDRPDGLKEVARLEYHRGSKRLGFLALFEKAEPATAAPKPAAAAKLTYYAQTERTRVPAELYSTRAEEVIKGLKDLLKD